MIVTSQYEEIRIWQLKLKKEIRRQVVKNMTCNAVDLTRDGKTIISGMIKKIPSFKKEFFLLQGEDLYKLCLSTNPH